MSRVLAIVGPTGVGKTAVSIDLARHLNGEIVSADSMLIYRGMDIGTAKPTKDERGKVTHHLIDVAEPFDDFSVSKYQEMSRAAIDLILGNKKLPILVGGSGLYVRAALDDLQFPPGDLRSSLRKDYAADTDADKERLWQKLKNIDPEAAEKIPMQNERRVIRALEIIETSGEKFSTIQKNWSKRDSFYDTFFIGLTMERDILYQKINKRVDKMIEDGLIDEVTSLLSQEKKLSTTASQALGYKEIVEYLEGRIVIDEAIDTIKKRSRRLAKRQFTWFKADKRIHWLSVEDENIDLLVSEIINLVSKEDFIVR